MNVSYITKDYSPVRGPSLPDSARKPQGNRATPCESVSVYIGHLAKEG